MLIYDESSNPDYSVSVETSLSKELIMLKVKTVFEPYSNEIWVRNANYDLDQSQLGKRNKFWLVQPMQGRGVRYHLKHAGQFLYKISNEDDIDKFKVTKIRLPHELQEQRQKLEASPIATHKKQEGQSGDVAVQKPHIARLGK